jgi:hypothetical protein
MMFFLDILEQRGKRTTHSLHLLKAFFHRLLIRTVNHIEDGRTEQLLPVLFTHVHPTSTRTCVRHDMVLAVDVEAVERLFERNT